MSAHSFVDDFDWSRIDALCILQVLDIGGRYRRRDERCGCGGNDASSASRVATPSSSSPSVNVEAAFAQVEEAVKPFWCSNAHSDIGDMAHAAVPPAAQTIIDKIDELSAAEITYFGRVGGCGSRSSDAALGHLGPQIAPGQLRLGANNPELVSEHKIDIKQYNVAHAQV